MAKKSRTLTIPDSIKSLQPIKERRGKPVYADNPFITASGGFQVQVRKDMSLVANGLEIKDKEENDVKAGVIGTIKYISKDEYVQIFPKKISSILDLPKHGSSAFKAVFWAVSKYAINKAEIYLNYETAKTLYEEYNEKCPSINTFNKGLKCLIENNIIACSAKGEFWYWTNPSILFNGSIVTFVEQYKIKRTEEQNVEQKAIQNNLIDGQPPKELTIS